MTPARPLRDVFTDLVGAPGTTDDPAALLREQGHHELPDELVAEAVVSYADTAPVEVAEHLASFVTAHSAVGADPGDEPPAGWLDLIGSAPDPIGADADLDDLTLDAADGPDSVDGPGFLDVDSALDFGTGSSVEAPDSADVESDLGESGAGESGADADLPDDSAGLPDWAPVDAAADLTADDSAEDADDTDDDDDGEPDAESLG